jgi:tetratricopeptide (TPR) repeat protein
MVFRRTRRLRRRAQELHTAVARGTDSERKWALRELRELCEATPDTEVWLRYSRALATAGYRVKQVEVLERLVASEPYDFGLRIELSSALDAIGHHEQAEQTMRELAPDLPPDVPALVRPRTDRARVELQRNALRSRIDGGHGTADDAVRLAGLALDHYAQEPDGEALNEAARVLEDARTRWPRRVDVLEHLLLVYSVSRAEPGRVGVLAQELEEIAPESPLMRVFKPVDDWLEHETRESHEGKRRLLRRAFDRDAGTRAAALEDLRSKVARFPGDLEYRTFYASALMVNGRRAQALEQAAAAAELVEEDNHEMNYNIGQVYLHAGKTRRAREHLLRARASARDDEERADADELLAKLPDD